MHFRKSRMQSRHGPSFSFPFFLQAARSLGLHHVVVGGGGCLPCSLISLPGIILLRPLSPGPTSNLRIHYLRIRQRCLGLLGGHSKLLRLDNPWRRETRRVHSLLSGPATSRSRAFVLRSLLWKLSGWTKVHPVLPHIFTFSAALDYFIRKHHCIR
jgi:hypothetical protein